jgi:transcription-repair coupling factor (superfamily II helicase)
VENLLAVAAFRLHARTYGVAEVALQGRYIRFAPLELRDSQSLRLQRLYKGTLVKAPTRTILVPVPTATGRMGSPALRDRALLGWAQELLDAVVGDNIGTAAAVQSAASAAHP